MEHALNTPSLPLDVFSSRLDTDVPALVRWIMQHSWPGNVRQLRNVVRQFVIGSRGEFDVNEIRACHRDLGGDLEAMVERLRGSKPALRRRIQELGLA